ncbi:10690_t:CDS:2 [Funneliformis mosseae]|uniref:10690_t:CDS:1 n=1 Tax=Funneliformis mosseae TaxID=27381 RepID=A0A9N8WEV2_FUNMO|nr:10690_t:CDS:2 [Funneliformis mosseae]
MFSRCRNKTKPMLDYNHMRESDESLKEKVTKLNVFEWIVQRMLANPYKKADAESILTWNYFSEKGKPLTNGFFQRDQYVKKEDRDSKKTLG